MTREEAIEIIEQDIPCEYDTDLIEALNMAINALEHPERNVVAVVPCGDTISRQAVIDIVDNPLNIRLGEIIEKLPPVKPERPKGEWLTPYGSYSYRLTTYKCSLCGCETDNRSNYCPNCGAYMREVSECSEENNAE